MTHEAGQNFDPQTIASFGEEWTTFDQQLLELQELQRWFDAYFAIFPWSSLPEESEGFDMGCGSGRWARFVAPRVKRLHCIEPSRAIEVAREALRDFPQVVFHSATTGSVQIPPESQDFGYSLGVLHHIPDPEGALRDCVRLLKPGAPLLLYLYYRFDNRPPWFVGLWWVSNLVRKVLCRLPEPAKRIVTDAIALLVYWPVSRLGCWLKSPSFPLYAYRDASLYTMRTDSRDRFGTPLEHRFTRAEIAELMGRCGLRNIEFSPHEPYWCAVGTKA